MIESAKVLTVSLDEPLAPIEVEQRHGHVLLVVTLGGDVLGELVLPVRDVLGIEAQRRAIAERLGERVWKARLAADFTRATRGPGRLRALPEPSVSVVVCTQHGGDGLRVLLDSLVSLNPSAHELIVVAPDGSARDACDPYPVTYIEEPEPGLARARNRGVAAASGDVVAFTEDGCVVDPGWLDGLAEAFEDSLTMAVQGYAGPLELDTPEQCELGLNVVCGRSIEPRTWDWLSLEEPRLAEGNCFFRRDAFARVGPFAELLGPGTPARAGHEWELHHRLLAEGFRVAFHPRNIAWTRPPKDARELRRALYARGAGRQAYATHCLLSRRDPTVLPCALSWWFLDLPRDIARTIRNEPGRLSPSSLLAELLGSLVSPWELLRSRISRRGVPQTRGPQPSPTANRQRPTAVTREADPPLTVAIASYNRREPLAELLGTLAHQTYPSDRFEAVVVLDGSTDGSSERVRALDLPYTVRVFEQENRGLAASRNRGVREASAPVVVFIDDDMEPVREFLAEHAAAHRDDRGPVAGLGACPPANPGDDLASLALRHWWEDYYRRRSEPDHKWTYTDFGDGNLSLPRALLEQTGGWDEAFSKEAVRRQDWELGIRLLKSGARFVDCTRASARHHFDVSLATSIRNRRMEGRGDVLLGRKHPSVREHLFLRRFIVDQHGRERQYRLLAERPDAAWRLVDLGARVARVLERGGVRWVAWNSQLRLISYAYLLGVRDALPGDDELRDFVAPMLRHELAGTVPVELERPGPIEVPPAIGAVDLLLTYGGRDLARVEAFEPEVQWDWGTLTERAVAQALDPYRAVAGDLAGAAPDPIHA